MHCALLFIFFLIRPTLHLCCFVFLSNFHDTSYLCSPSACMRRGKPEQFDSCEVEGPAGVKGLVYFTDSQKALLF